MAFLHLDRRGISSERGYSWIVPIPATFGAGDTVGELLSTLILFEDDLPLGPPHAAHDEIREVGHGAYSHWHSDLYFSTSDGSDPRENGRRYRVFTDRTAVAECCGPEGLAALARGEQQWFGAAAAPVNLRQRNVEEIGQEVDYAIFNARLHLRNFEAMGLSLSGLRVLEIGPGINFGMQLILQSCGAQVILADRFLSGWEENYHPAYYTALLEAWDGPNSALRRTLEIGGYEETLILVPEPAEALVSIPAASVDAVLSNAVLEHVVDVSAVANELARVTRQGGINVHLIDFRDHRDFSVPLEFLLVDDGEYQAEFERCFGERGNRMRPSETEALFLSAGLEIASTELGSDTHWNANPTYLADLLPRLRASPSCYRNWPEEGLRTLVAKYMLRRTDDPEVGERGRQMFAKLQTLRRF